MFSANTVTSTFVGYSFAFPGVAAYAASKSGLIGLTQALAAEFGPRGVRVNAILPGAVETGMYREMNDTADKQAFMTNLHALKRVAQPEELGLRLSLRQADADALPFADQSFDYVLSWNVIFHGSLGDVGRRLAEIWRILKPGGLYQGTMQSKRDMQFGRGRPVAPDTFIRGSDPKAHPHYYCDLAGLAVLFAGFELLSLNQEEQRRPGSWHWHILVERR